MSEAGSNKAEEIVSELIDLCDQYINARFYSEEATCRAALTDRITGLVQERGESVKLLEECRNEIRQKCVVCVRTPSGSNILWCVHCDVKVHLPSVEPLVHAEGCIVRRMGEAKP